jgi:lipopolysaccharide biosynthesis glycosyltransferase
VPENCAFTSVKHPEGALHAPQITQQSPRPYGLLNSGCVVLNPSEELFKSLEHYLASSPDVVQFLFPDQDLLAAFFKGRWKPLPYIYNALKTLRVIHSPLWQDEEIRCLHYILSQKPWQGRQTGDEYQELNEWWWQRYDALEKEMHITDPSGWKLVDQYVAHG